MAMKACGRWAGTSPILILRPPRSRRDWQSGCRHCQNRDIGRALGHCEPVDRRQLRCVIRNEADDGDRGPQAQHHHAVEQSPDEGTPAPGCSAPPARAPRLACASLAHARPRVVAREPFRLPGLLAMPSSRVRPPARSSGLRRRSSMSSSGAGVPRTGSAPLPWLVLASEHAVPVPGGSCLRLRESAMAI